MPSFVLSYEGEFKIGGIEFCVKNYVAKLERERIQDWAISVLDLYRAKIRLGEFKAVYSILFPVSAMGVDKFAMEVHNPCSAVCQSYSVVICR